MTLKQRLDDDLKAAMRSGDTVTRDAIRLIRGQVKNAEIDKGRDLDDTAVAEVLARMAKQHRDSIEQFKAGKRADLVANEEGQLGVVLRYMPQQMSREDVLGLARQAAAEVGAKGPTDKGKVMGKLMPQVRGKADGAVVNAVVTELLESLAKS